MSETNRRREGVGSASETQVLLVDERRWAQLVAETHRHPSADPS